MFSRRRRRRAERRVKPGDGHPLPRFRWWQPFTRALFHLDLSEPDGTEHTWSVDVHLMGDDSDGEVRARLYRDALHQASSTLPATLPVPGGVIEVDASQYGLKQCRYAGDDGAVRPLQPDPASGEAWRASLEQRRPGLSRAISVTSVVILVAALAFGLPQLAEQITHIPPVAEHVGTFTSPVRLPGWLNTALVVAAALASCERALRLQYSWLLDGGLLEEDDG